jgi:hypothetical protein
MLRLVHPAREGQGTDPPTRRKGYKAPALFLTADEARHLRATVKNVARAYGSLECLAAVLGIGPGVLTRKSRRPSPGLALAVARAAGMSLEAVIGGKLSPAGRCEACGSRVGDRPQFVAGGAS